MNCTVTYPAGPFLFKLVFHTTFLSSICTQKMLFYLASILDNAVLPFTLKVKSWDEKNVIYLLKKKYNSRILNEDTIVVMMLGNVIPVETSSTKRETGFYTVIFDVLLFSPQIGEIVPSSVHRIRESEIIASVGPFGAHVHKLQILDGKLKMDIISQTATVNEILIKKETIIRGKITSVSIPYTGVPRIDMTCSQKYLGVLEDEN